MQQEVRDRMFPEPVVHVHVIEVKFDPDSKIPPAIQNEISKNEIGRTHGEDADSDFLDDAAKEIAEVGVRGTLQDAGYFRVLPEAKLTVLKRDGPKIDVVAHVSAEVGEQYRIGEIKFEPADPRGKLSYSPESLREKIPLKRGEIVNVDKIREGLRNLTSLYGEDGYIDFTAEPEFDISEERKIIDLTLKLDLQSQYRIRGIEFWGVGPQVEEQLRKSYQKSGEIFSKLRLEQFFKENRALLPANFVPHEDINFYRDTHAGMLDLVFDLRSCPGPWH